MQWIKRNLKRGMAAWGPKQRLGTAAALLAIMLAAAIFFQHRQTAALPTGAWGLSFREKNQPPVADARAEDLAPYDAKYIDDTAEKIVYLTFDCGYENGNTAAILDALKAHDAPAAFFVVGHFLETEPDLVRRMAQEGHTVGNHTWNHPDMSGISDLQKFSDQLRRVEEAYEAVTGAQMPKYYRPPQGVYSQENLEMAKKLGYRTVFWSLAYVDWKTDQQPSTDQALETLENRVHPGAVVLLHNTSSTNAAILDQILTRWEDMGYRFGTLEELFADTKTD